MCFCLFLGVFFELNTHHTTPWPPVKSKVDLTSERCYPPPCGQGLWEGEEWWRRVGNAETGLKVTVWVVGS